MIEIQYILVTASLSYLITRNRLFKSFREGISRKRQKNIGWKQRMWLIIEQLTHCEYCMGFWFGVIFYWPLFKMFDIFQLICYSLIAAISSSVIVKQASKQQ